MLQYISIPQAQKNLIHLRRDKTKFNADAYCYELEHSLHLLLATQSILSAEIFDICFQKFTHTLKTCIDKHASLKWLSRKEMKLKSKLWITKEIMVSIKRKRKMLETHFRLGNNHLKEVYEVYINKLTEIKTLSKMNYFERELRNNSSNLRKTWETLQSLLPTKSRKSTNLHTKLLVHHIEISNPKATVQ